jgi:hypothetical protein
MEEVVGSNPTRSTKRLKHLPFPCQPGMWSLATTMDAVAWSRLGPVETGILRYITNHRPYLPGLVRLGIFRSPFTTGGKSFTSSYTSVMNRSLLCFVSPSVVA